jgi:hypothetical protein
MHTPDFTRRYALGKAGDASVLNPAAHCGCAGRMMNKG